MAGIGSLQPLSCNAEIMNVTGKQEIAIDDITKYSEYIGYKCKQTLRAADIQTSTQTNPTDSDANELDGK